MFMKITKESCVKYLSAESERKQNYLLSVSIQAALTETFASFHYSILRENFRSAF